MEWLLSASPKVYDHIKAFKHLERIDWTKLNTKFEVGDIVFIYSSFPIQKITHKCVIENVEIVAEAKVADDQYWVSKSSSENAKKGLYVRLKLLGEFNLQSLGLKYLNENGLKGTPQGRRKLNSDLIKYINEQIPTENLIFNSECFSTKVKEASRLSTPEMLKLACQYSEHPVRKKVSTYVYDRNPYIVALCLEAAKGRCQRCENSAPFNKRISGEPFLEVHHVVPLSIGGKDTLDNVLALCPNCHRELHYG